MPVSVIARGAALALAVLVCGSAAGAPPVPDPTRDFARHLGFDDDSFASIERGAVIVKTLDLSAGNEIAIAGAVHVGVPRGYFVTQWRDITSFKRNAKVPEIGTFDNPSVLRDLDTLTVPDTDVAAFRNCSIGHCSVKLPIETFGLLQHDGRNGFATADRENVRVFKEMLTARVQAFRSGGTAMLTSYGGSPSASPKTEIAAILAASPDTLQAVPEFRAYLAEYPGPRLADVDEFSYWSKETAGPKPIISLTHVSVYTKAFDQGRVDALLEAVRCAAAVLPRHRAAAEHPRARQHRGGVAVWMGALRRPRGDDHRREPLRRVGVGTRRDARVRLHGGACR